MKASSDVKGDRAVGDIRAEGLKEGVSKNGTEGVSSSGGGKNRNSRLKRRKTNGTGDAEDSDGYGDIEESVIAEGNEYYCDDVVVLDSDSAPENKVRAGRKRTAPEIYKEKDVDGEGDSDLQASGKSDNDEDKDFVPHCSVPRTFTTNWVRGKADGRRVKAGKTSMSRKRTTVGCTKTID